MPLQTRKLLTIVAEAVLENQLSEMLDKLGASGYTIVDARGRGSRGVRDAGWASSGNIRIEVVCGSHLATAILDYVREHYYRDYAMIVFTSDVSVIRPEKF